MLRIWLLIATVKHSETSFGHKLISDDFRWTVWGQRQLHPLNVQVFELLWVATRCWISCLRETRIWIFVDLMWCVANTMCGDWHGFGQMCVDARDEPLQGSLLTSQDSMESIRAFFPRLKSPLFFLEYPHNRSHSGVLVVVKTPPKTWQKCVVWRKFHWNLLLKPKGYVL